MLHEYRSTEIADCLQCQHIAFVGDSNIRQLFWAVARKLDFQRAEQARHQADYHQHQKFNHGCIGLDFFWDPYLNSSILYQQLAKHSNDHDSSDLTNTTASRSAQIVVGAGLWYARNLGDHGQEAFEASVDKILKTIQSKPSHLDSQPVELATRSSSIPSTILFAPIPVPFYQRLSGSRAETLTPRKISGMNEYLKKRSDETGMQVLWSFIHMSWHRPLAYENNGIHVVDSIATNQADVVLNLRCNGEARFQHYPFDKPCCSRFPSINSIQYLLLGLAIGTCLCLCLRKRLWDAFSACMLHSGSVQSLGDPDQGIRLLQALLVLVAGTLYCFLADRSSLFDKVQRTFNESHFVSMVGCVFIVGLLTIRRSGVKLSPMPDKQFHRTSPSFLSLSRDQTDELKGWMQVIILAYHYTGMSQTLWVYQIIRVLVAAYIFLTGYGHTIYFLETKDFSLHRVASVLVRLNLLSCILPYVMRTDYDFYYFSGLCSLWFLITYATLKIDFTCSIGYFIFKVSISALIVSSLISMPGLVELIAKILAVSCKIQLSVHEFRFRVSLDLYIAYIGMLCGMLNVKYNHSRSAVRYTAPVKQLLPMLQSLSILASLICLPGYFYYIRSFPNKHAYNAWHTIISPVPVLSYLVLRNATSSLRECTSAFFAWLGRISLETFIMQYHIWLAADTKGVLSLGLWDRIPNQDLYERVAEFVVITAFFLLTSWEVSQATAVLTRSLVGPRPHSIKPLDLRLPQTTVAGTYELKIDEQKAETRQLSKLRLGWTSNSPLSTTSSPSLAPKHPTTLHYPPKTKTSSSDVMSDQANAKSTLSKRLATTLVMMWLANWVSFRLLIRSIGDV